MAETGSNFPGDIEALLDSLRGYLHSEMSISQPSLMTFDEHSGVHPKEQERVEITVHVRNDAPPSEKGGEVVFMGVGLRISDGRGEYQANPPRWPRGIPRDRPTDHQELRQRYNRGTWVGGSQQAAFPATTQDEESFGEVLFPGESVIYKMQIPTAYLPYIEVKIEGSVSRRHLFHFVQTPKALEALTKPFLVEAFRAINAIDIHRPLQSATRHIPEFGPQTTLEEVTAYRQAVSEAIGQIGTVRQALNRVYQSAPRQEIRDHLKQVMGRYLSSTDKTCADALQALSTGDTDRMRDAAGALRQLKAASQEVDRETLQLMSRFGITPEEAGFGTNSGS